MYLDSCSKATWEIYFYIDLKPKLNYGICWGENRSGKALSRNHTVGAISADMTHERWNVLTVETHSPQLKVETHSPN